MTELTPSEITGRRIKTLRKAKGWSVRRLVDECAAVGFEVTSNVIENIEGIQRERAHGSQRRRGITVDELMALALVLDVSPLALLLPEEPSAYPITPDVQPSAESVYQWLIATLERPRESPNAPTPEEQLFAGNALHKALPWTKPSPLDLVQQAVMSLVARERAREAIQRYVEELPGGEAARVTLRDLTFGDLLAAVDFDQSTEQGPELGIQGRQEQEGRSDGTTEDLQGGEGQTGAR